MRSLEAINSDYKDQCTILGDLHVKRDGIDALVLTVKQKIVTLQAEAQEFVKMQEELKKAQMPVKETLPVAAPVESVPGV